MRSFLRVMTVVVVVGAGVVAAVALGAGEVAKVSSVAGAGLAVVFGVGIACVGVAVVMHGEGME